MAREKLFILKHLHIDGTHTEYVKKADYDSLMIQAKMMATALEQLQIQYGAPHEAYNDAENECLGAYFGWLTFIETSKLSNHPTKGSKETAPKPNSGQD